MFHEYYTPFLGVFFTPELRVCYAVLWGIFSPACLVTFSWVKFEYLKSFTPRARVPQGKAYREMEQVYKQQKYRYQTAAVVVVNLRDPVSIETP
jgi:hypothetical protein